MNTATKIWTFVGVILGILIVVFLTLWISGAGKFNSETRTFTVSPVQPAGNTAGQTAAGNTAGQAAAGNTAGQTAAAQTTFSMYKIRGEGNAPHGCTGEDCVMAVELPAQALTVVTGSPFAFQQIDWNLNAAAGEGSINVFMNKTDITLNVKTLVWGGANSISAHTVTGDYFGAAKQLETDMLADMRDVNLRNCTAQGCYKGIWTAIWDCTADTCVLVEKQEPAAAQPAAATAQPAAAAAQPAAAAAQPAAAATVLFEQGSWPAVEGTMVPWNYELPANASLCLQGSPMTLTGLIDLSTQDASQGQGSVICVANTTQEPVTISGTAWSKANYIKVIPSGDPAMLRNELEMGLKASGCGNVCSQVTTKTAVFTPTGWLTN